MFRVYCLLWNHFLCISPLKPNLLTNGGPWKGRILFWDSGVRVFQKYVIFKNVVTYKPDRSCVTPFCKEPNAEIVEIEGISRRFLRLAPCKGCYITSVRFIPLEKRLICWVINRELIKPTDAPLGSKIADATRALKQFDHLMIDK